MDVNAIAGTASTLADVGIKQEVNIAVQKKAQDIATDTATALIAAIPDNKAASNLPPNLGRNVNTTA